MGRSTSTTIKGGLLRDSERPNHARVRDPDIVAAIIAGDPAGLAAAYDTYAAPLYTCCRSSLRDTDDAAHALRDTFVAASQKLHGLRDPEQLRPLLYAMARNECLRLLGARRRTLPLVPLLPLEGTDDVSDDPADLTLGVHQQELRDSVRSAFNALNASDREVLDLSMRHELNGPELGAALGVSTSHAHALLSRARGRLETALGALLVARAGNRDCEQLAELLGDRDGHFNTVIRRRVNRHIEGCATCRERRGIELQSAVLLGLGPILRVPPEIRAKILRLCADSTPEAARQRTQVRSPEPTPEAAARLARITRIAERAEPFDSDTGFPIPLKRRRREATAVGRRATAVSSTLALLLLLACATAASAAPHLGPSGRTAHKADPRIVVASTSTPLTIAPVSTPPNPTKPVTAAQLPSKSPSPPLPPTSAPPTRRGPSRHPGIGAEQLNGQSASLTVSCVDIVACPGKSGCPGYNRSRNPP